MTRPTPTPAEVLAARKAAGLTQVQAAELVFCGARGWQKWESGDCKMHPAIFAYFCLVAGVDVRRK